MSNTEAKDRTPQEYMLGPADGEHLVHWRDGGQILIKVGGLSF
jgi:hypothetical protein